MLKRKAEAGLASALPMQDQAAAGSGRLGNKMYMERLWFRVLGEVACRPPCVDQGFMGNPRSLLGVRYAR